MSRHRVLLRVFTVVALSTLPAWASAADKVLLRCRFKKGEKYVVATVLDQDIDQKAGDNANTMKQKMHMTMGLEVLKTDPDGTAEVRITYRRFALKQESSMADPLDYDSGDRNKKDVNHPALAGFKALVGKSFSVTMDDRGRIKTVKGVKELAEGLLAEVPAGPGRQVARQQIARLLNEDTLSQQMASVGANCPEQPVGVGDTWHQQQKNDIGFARLSLSTRYTVKTVTADTVEVEAVSTMTATPSGDLPVTIRLDKGAQSGTIRVRRANALLTAGKLDQDIRMTVTVQDATITMSMKGVADISVTAE